MTIKYFWKVSVITLSIYHEYSTSAGFLDLFGGMYLRWQSSVCDNYDYSSKEVPQKIYLIQLAILRKVVARKNPSLSLASKQTIAKN